MNLSFKKILHLFAAAVALMIAAPSSLYAQTCSSVDPATQLLAYRSPFLGDLVAQRNFEQSLEKLQTPAMLGSRRRLTSHSPEKMTPLAGEELAQTSLAGPHSGEKWEDDGNCIDNDPQNDICRTTLETPISTAPTLFTQYQAKQAANTVFTRLNEVFRQLQEEEFAAQLKQGIKDSTQPKKSMKPETLLRWVKGDVVRLQELLPPHLALSHYFGTLAHNRIPAPFSGNSCQVKDQNPSCKRLPFNAPGGVSFDHYTTVHAVTPSSPYLLKRPLSQNQVLPLTFPEIHPLFNQTIQEVALPPPKC